MARIKYPEPKKIKGSRYYYLKATICGVEVSKSTKCLTIEAARAKIPQMVKAVELEIALTGGQSNRITLRQATERMNKEVWRHKKTGNRYLQQMEVWMDILGEDTMLHEVDTWVIDDAIQELYEREMTAPTINRHLSPLSGIFKRASTKWRLLKTLPYIERQPENGGRRRIVKPRELEELVSILREARFQHASECADFFIVLHEEGFRVGELYDAKAVAIDFTKGLYGEMSVLGKRNMFRTIPLTKRAADTLRPYYDRANGKKGLWNMPRRTIRYAWDYIKKAMDLEDDTQFVPHSLRHTCATNLLCAQYDLVDVQAWMGHTNIGTTRRYLHMTAGRLHRVQEQLTKPTLTVIEGGKS